MKIEALEDMLCEIQSLGLKAKKVTVCDQETIRVRSFFDEMNVLDTDIWIGEDMYWRISGFSIGKTRSGLFIINYIKAKYSLDCLIDGIKPINNSQWISVNDMLPESSMGEIGTNVLATDGSTYHFSFINNNRWFSNDDQLRNITHWQPLPTPPEKK